MSLDMDTTVSGDNFWKSQYGHQKTLRMAEVYLHKDSTLRYGFDSVMFTYFRFPQLHSEFDPV